MGRKSSCHLFSEMQPELIFLCSSNGPVPIHILLAKSGIKELKIYHTRLVGKIYGGVVKESERRNWGYIF